MSDSEEFGSAKSALRKQSEWLQLTLSSIGDGVIATDANGRVTFLNAVAESLTGWSLIEAVGRPLAEIFRILREPTDTVLVARDGIQRPIEERASPMRDYDGVPVGAVLVFRDVTDRKRDEEKLRESENRHRFLSELASAKHSLSDPAELMQTTARLLAEHLNVDRCAYAEVENESVFVITGDHTIGVPSIVGRWPVAAFGNECTRRMRANEPHVVDDVDTDPRIAEGDIPAYRATAIRAVICVPLHKDGKFTAAMAVHQKTPRHWTPAEVQLVTAVVARCWESLERARVTRVLREREERALDVLERFTDAFVSFDRAWRFTYVNRQAGRLLNREPSGLLGKVVWTEYPGLVGGEFERAWHHAMSEGTCSSVTSWYPDHQRWYEVHTYPSPDGIAIYFRDVSERMASEQALRDSEERYRRTAVEAGRAASANAKFRAFFEQGMNFAGVLALDGTVVEANRHCLDACGFTREEVIGKPFWECGWWNRSPELIEMVREASLQAVAGRSFRTETNYFIANGAERVVDLILAPVTDESGHVLFIAATGTDITKRKRMEDVLREADRKKDDFIALLAHELRNPLAPIRNGLQVIRLAEDRAEREVAREMMDRQLAHMVRLIDDLLDVSRISRNKLDLRLERVALSDVITSAIETARPLIDLGKHELTISLPERPIYLNADLMRLAQVFSNLLTNSAKYTEPSGHIWLTAKVRNKEVVVSVRDTGIGIPSESLVHIFDMFSQVDRSMERSTGGLGIGLSLVKGLVEMHSGSVTVASEGEGKGSEFTVTLPALEAPPNPEVGPANRRAVPSSKRRILIVDDNRDGANSLALVLRLMGNEVRTAGDGQEGFEVAEQFRPDVVLMDMAMPRLNGLDATRLIREQPWGKELSIIALTGWGKDDDRERSREAGCEGHLVKPVDLSELENVLNELLANRG